MELWDSSAKLRGCKPLQPLHLEKVEQNLSNGLVPFIEREAPGIREEAAGPSRGAPGAGPELFSLRPGKTTHQGQLHPDRGAGRVC